MFLYFYRSLFHLCSKSTTYSPALNWKHHAWSDTVSLAQSEVLPKEAVGILNETLLAFCQLQVQAEQAQGWLKKIW